MTMVMETISASEFKARCLALLDGVAEGGEIVVTKRGKPVAKVVPVDPIDRSSLRGSVTQLVSDEGLIAPLDEAWSGDADNIE